MEISWQEFAQGLNDGVYTPLVKEGESVNINGTEYVISGRFSGLSSVPNRDNYVLEDTKTGEPRQFTPSEVHDAILGTQTNNKPAETQGTQSNKDEDTEETEDTVEDSELTAKSLVDELGFDAALRNIIKLIDTLQYDISNKQQAIDSEVVDVFDRLSREKRKEQQAQLAELQLKLDKAKSIKRDLAQYAADNNLMEQYNNIHSSLLGQDSQNETDNKETAEQDGKTEGTKDIKEKKPEEKKKNISEAEEISNRLKELAKQFGVDVEVHETLDTIDNKEARAEIKKGSIVNGFYSKGKIHLVVPSLMMDGGISRAEEVFVHEVVVHHGLMKILSAKGAERWNEFRDNIWAKMSVGDRIRYRNYVKDTVREGTSEEEIRRIAAEEYLAAMAEGFASDVLTETEKTIFDDIVQLLLDFMKAIGLHMTEKSCKDLLVAVASQMREEAKKNNAESETETEEKSEPKDNVEDTDNEDVDANNKPKGNPKSEPKTKTESNPKEKSDKEVIEEETTEQKKAESKQEEQKEIKEDKKEIEDKPTEKQKRVRYKTVKPLVQQEKRKLFNERIKKQGVINGKVTGKKISLYDAVSKDPFKPALTGVYHDPTSLRAVAANGHILIIDNTSYDDNYRGQIIDKKGKVIEYTYPKYEIVYKNGGPRVSSNNVDFKELLKFINGAKTKVKKEEKDKDGNIYPFVHLGLRDNAGNVESYNVEMLETLVRHAIRMGLDKLEFYDFVNDSYRLDAVGKNGRIVIVPTPIEFYHAYDLLDNGGTRFSISKNEEEFKATQRQAVEEKGIVMPGLNNAIVNVVDVPRHDFTGTGKDALRKAEDWSNKNIVGEHIYHKGQEDEFKYTIDKDAIGKFLSKSSTTESDNLGVHLAVLKKLPEVIDNSIDVEIHPDYKKVDNKRSADNGVGNEDLLVHRMYGAVSIDGRIYRAKTTIHEFKNKDNRAYDYKITEVELIISGSSTSNALNSSTSISATKILNEVEKSYDKGKKVLEESKNNTRFSRTREEVEAYANDLRFCAKKDLKTFPTLYNVAEKYWNDNKHKMSKIVNDAKSVDALVDLLDALYNGLMEEYFLSKAEVNPNRVRHEIAQLKNTDPNTLRRILNAKGIDYKNNIDDYTNDELREIGSGISDVLTEKRRAVGEQWKEVLERENVPTRYLVLRSLLQYISKNKEAVPVNYLEGAFVKTMDRFNESANPTSFNFYAEYNKSIAEVLFEDTDNVIEISREEGNGISGKWGRMKKQSESADVEETKAKVSAISYNTSWCTKHANVDGTGAKKVIEEDNHDFYVFVKDGETTGTMAIVPIREEEGEDVLKNNPWYTGIFKQSNGSDNSIEPEYFDVVNALARKAKDTDLVRTLDLMGYNGMTKEEMAELQRQKHAKQIEWLNSHDVITEADFADINDMFGILLRKNGDDVVLHELPQGIYEQPNEVIRDLFWEKVGGVITTIEGDIILEGYTQLTLPNVTSVGGDVKTSGNTQLTLPNVTSVGGNVATYGNSQLTLPNVTSVGVYVETYDDTQLTLPNVTSVGGNVATYGNSQLTLPNVTEIRGYVETSDNSQLTLPNVTSVGGYVATSGNTQLTLPNVTSVGGYVATRDNSQLTLPSSMQGKYEGNITWVDNTRFSRTREEVERELAEIKAKAIADGTFKKAPNGKRSNLGERQWLHVRLKSFKKWFGDWELAYLYNRALTAWNSKDSKGKVVFGLSDRAKERFNEVLGTDIKQLVITDDAIRHIKKRHGENQELQGQKNMTPEDIVVIPYLVNNFDSMELNPLFDDNRGNRAIEIRKRINGVSVIATIERGENKEFLVTSYQFVKSDALDASKETPGLYVRNDSDIANVQQEIETIKESAKNSSKVVDENGEPMEVYHGTPNEFTIFDTKRSSGMMFFTDEKSLAESFKRKHSNRDGNIVEAFLNIRNPKEHEMDGYNWYGDGVGKNSGKSINKGRKHNFSYVEALNAKRKGNDGVILNNVTDNRIKSNHYIVFTSNQIKSATDNIGTYDGENDDVRFSLVNDLVAVHNLSEDKLRKAIDMGGLIMPSIAITNTKIGHTSFGDISLLFDKDTIDPSDRRNKVYGGDAWTPRFPQLEPKINESVAKGFRKKIEELLSDARLRGLYNVSSEVHESNISDNIRNGGVERYYNKEFMKHAYLLDKGNKVKVPTKPYDYGMYADVVIDLAKARGVSLSDINNGGFDFYKNNEDFVNELNERVIDIKVSYLSISEVEKEKVRGLLSENGMPLRSFISYTRQAFRKEQDLNNGGLKEIVDSKALLDDVNRRVNSNNANYRKWVNDLFDGIIEKYGIRNNKDWYTPSGTLRSWETLYDNVTPSNILKHMLSENQQGGGQGVFNSSIFGASAEEYSSIEEIRERGKERFQKEDEDVYDEWTKSVYNRLSGIGSDVLGSYSSFGDSMDFNQEIINAVSNDKTAKGIYKKIKRYYPKFTMSHAKQVEDIVKEIQAHAVGYFEAKPQRIIPLSEIRKAIVPSNISKDIVDKLKDSGVEVTAYRNGNENSRQRLIKKVSNDIRFSRNNRNQSIFVSNAQRAVEGIKQDKATPEQWLKMIEKQGGLKAGEDKWLGLSDWLKANDNKSITKQEILDFIGENKIQIEEVAYRDVNDNTAFESLKQEYEQWLREEGSDYAWNELVERYGDDAEIAFSDLGGELGIENEDAASSLLGSDNIINSTRLDYTTKGLGNKREIALVVPTIESWRQDDEVHFGDAGNGRAVAWVRFGETTDSDGNSVLVIDEIQSKRHQEGREEGYEHYFPISGVHAGEYVKVKDEKYADRISFAEVTDDRDIRIGQIEKIDGKYRPIASNGQRIGFKEFDTEQEALDVVVKVYTRVDGVPSAPFDKNWHEIAMKRMLRLAAEEGYDKVAWTKGMQQTERYELRKVIDEIAYWKGSDGRWGITAGDTSDTQKIDQQYFTETELKNTFGRDIAERIINDEGVRESILGYPEDPDVHYLNGETIEVGGEGMKGFYDEILPRFMNKYGKKWGVKVDEVELPNVEEAGRKMWSVDITPEMEESVMEGQTMFSRERVNDRFNAELDDYIVNGAKVNTIFHLGMPYGVMQAFLPMKQIVMRPRIINKASNKKHNVDATSLYNLPLYISEPIFVFKREDNTLGVLTEIKDRDGKNVCVAIELNKKMYDRGTLLEVNDIRSIHGRDAINLILPIINNNTLEYVDKKKGLEWLSSASYNYQQEIANQDLLILQR